MSIYSANRTSSNGTAVIAANEAYKTSNFGDILIECAANDMALFEGVLACDFHEIVGLKEGTLLEAEVEEANKKSIKSLMAKCAETVKKWWAKVKAMFQAAIDKIAAFVNAPQYKVFVKNFEKVYKQKGWQGELDAELYNTNHACLRVKKDTEFGILLNGHQADGKTSNELATERLRVMVGADKDFQVKDYTKKALDKCKIKEKINTGKIPELVKSMNCKDDMIAINAAKRDAEAAVKAYINDLTKAEQEGDASKILMLTSAFQIMNSSITRAAIAVTRANVLAKKKVLRNVLADINKKDSKELNEAAAMDDEYEFDNIMDTAEDFDTDTQEAVAECVKSIV